MTLPLAPSRPLSKVLFAIVLITLLGWGADARATPPFTLFESGQVRPLGLSPGGKLLFAVNTPDNRLEVFRVNAGGLVHRASIPVGLEPVALAVRSETEVWVVNHLSDSVSVVELGHEAYTGRVARTLLVGDEPRDIVFAGPGRRRAFITTAHRGQNSPIDPALTTPGVGRADVWVFDADHLGSSLGSDPLSIITLFSDTPRALAVTPDGSRVYAAAFQSGNRTTTVFDLLVPDGGEANNGLPLPNTNFEGVPAPEVGLIARWNGAYWSDELGRNWNDQVNFSLPDRDVFVIDAMSSPPAQVAGPGGFFSGVGTVLNNMIVNPVSGKVYVSNTEARNENRFEGPGIFAGHSVQGHLHESRITVLGAAGSVAPRHLNKHIDYSTCCAPVPSSENARSLASPQGMAVTRNGATLYVAALGSSKIGVYNTAALENDTFVPSVANQISVSGGGPTGLALNEARSRLYALTRFDNSISIINTATKTEVAHVPMHNPEPASVTSGRRFLYDASLSSSHGDSSCSSCHISGDLDSLAWDLGNPDGSVFDMPGPFIGPTLISETFHPMKGPMVTQSLRGMDNHGPMHWRGDRTGGNDEPTAQPDGGTFNERAAFMKFGHSFVDLLGRDAEIPTEDLASFRDFALQMTYPPNPIRALDNSLTPDEQAGRDFYFGPPSIAVHNVNCVTCHVLDPAGNPGSPAPGFFGTDGHSSFSFTAQLVKIPHLRNQYQKVGMFGLPQMPIIRPGLNTHLGDQIRGFGFTHDGSFDSIFRFMSTIAFAQGPGNETGFPNTAEGDVLRRQVEAFQLAFDSNLAPIVGQQVTLGHDNAAVAEPRLELLISRANLGECDLVAKTEIAGQELGFVYLGARKFMGNRQSSPPFSSSSLRALSGWFWLDVTYTCAPPGSGVRVGIDRDGDGFLDGDEQDAGSDPADPVSTP